jgi:hypothetical protein
MDVRIKLGLSVLSALVIGAIAACAGQVVDADGNAIVEGDAGNVNAKGDGAPSTTSGGDDSGTTTPVPTGDDGGSATILDSGPPATIGDIDSGPDAGPTPDAGLPAGECNTLADCSQSLTGVSGVTCNTTTHQCVITCSGDNYDVNGVVSDGCEVANPCPNGNGTQKCPVEHSTASATDLGSFDCSDGDSAQNDTASVPSDARTHNPAVVAFDGTAGAAPTVLHIYASGGFTCEDDLNLNLQMNGAAHPACYSLVAQVVGGNTYTCGQTDATGLCQIQNGSGSYSDGSDIYILVSKLDSCGTTDADHGAFTITGHL